MTTQVLISVFKKTLHPADSSSCGQEQKYSQCRTTLPASLGGGVSSNISQGSFQLCVSTSLWTVRSHSGHWTEPWCEHLGPHQSYARVSVIPYAASQMVCHGAQEDPKMHQWQGQGSKQPTCLFAQPGAFAADCEQYYVRVIHPISFSYQLSGYCFTP